MLVREAIQEGNTKNASTIKRMLKASLKREVGEKSFSARVLRIFMTEKMLCLEAKIPKKKPLMIYKSELTIWLKLFMMLPPVFTVKLIITSLKDMDKRAGGLFKWDYSPGGRQTHQTVLLRQILMP